MAREREADMRDQAATDEDDSRFMALSDTRSSQDKHVLTRAQILDVADKCFAFCQEASGVTLYGYQQRFGLRIVQSLLLEDGEEITALFSRQSGKTETVAVIVVGLMVILPKMAKLPGLCEDSRINKFKDGLWVGIFAPKYETGAIMHKRMATRMSSPRMREVCKDPEIALDLPKGRSMMYLPNGSKAACHSAGPQSFIEGETYHLLICEETQHISNYKLRKSIHPMAAATGGSIVKIGTPAPYRNDFYDACERGRKKTALRKPGQLETHFEFDYEWASKSNPRYKRYIDREMERLGFDSDEFRMSYRLHWLLDRGSFVAPEVFDKCGVQVRDILRSKEKRSGRVLTFVRPDYPGTQDKTTFCQVASIDIGRSSDSTVVTVGRVFWDCPVQFSGEERYPIHVVNWLELQGDNHEVQYPQILSFLSNYNLGILVVDATGRGDPVFARLQSDLSGGGKVEYKHPSGKVDIFEFPKEGITVLPFVFGETSKANGYTLFLQELTHGRFTYPAGPGARKQRKYQRFVQQMYELEKHYKGKHMRVHAPEDRKGSSKAHDDYPDSAMMLCWGVHNQKSAEMESGDNPFLTSQRAEMSRARAYFGGRSRGRNGLTQ